ncbi:MAG: T9SS type B sorting domain-containing protein, partial [Novosphingobium sp.]
MTSANAGFTYSINGTDFQSGTTFAGLAAGSYTITTQNADGCTSVTAPIIINPAIAPAVATTTVTQPTCSAISTGIIVVEAPTGTGFTYSIDGTNFQAGTTFGNLPAGTYNVTVQNADGCTSVSPNIVINAAQPIPVAATTTVTQPTCAVTSGTITVTDPTGTGLTYSLDGTTFQSAPVFAGLTPGTYNVTVQNAVGCTSTSADIIINAVPAAPAVATTTVSQPTCAVTTGSITVSTPQGTGFTYSIDGTNFQSGTTFAGLAPGSYTITVSNAGCTSVTTPIVINAVPADPIAATATVIQPTCASPTGSITISNPTGSGLTYSIDGTNFQSSITFNNVAAGSYTITVRNSGGCTSQSAAITLNDAGVPAVASVSVTQPTCITTSGTITVDGPFGTGFSYSIDGTNYQVDNVFAGLAPGSYSVTVQNGSGCTSAAVNAVINDVPTAPAMATISTVQPTCNVPSGTINISGPTTAGLTYSINGTDFQEGTSFTNVAPGTYTLVVQNEAGCLSDGVAFTIDALPEFCDIPKGISPNNDGKNDNFDISFLEASRLNIFNRYGKEVYARSNYSNEWFGQSNNGDELPTGTYYYV